MIADPRTAARLLGAAEAAHARRGVRTSVPASARYGALRSRLEAALGAGELDAELAEGARLEVDGAVAEALAALGDACPTAPASSLPQRDRRPADDGRAMREVDGSRP